MDRDLIDGVTRTTAVALIPVAAVAGALGGWPGAAGALAGELVSLASFRWIARGSGRAAHLFAGGRPSALWLLGLGARHITLVGHIAYIAARMMAEDGIADYATAKQKAARQALEATCWSSASVRPSVDRANRYSPRVVVPKRTGSSADSPTNHRNSRL